MRAEIKYRFLKPRTLSLHFFEDNKEELMALLAKLTNRLSIKKDILVRSFLWFLL